MDRSNGAARGWRLGLLGLTGMLATGQNHVTMPMLQQLATTFDTSVCALAGPTAAHTAGFIAGLLVGGVVADRMDAWRAVRLGLALAATTTAAVTLASSPMQFLGIRGVQGVAAGSLVPACFAAVRRDFPARWLSPSIAVLSCCGFSSIVAAPLLARATGSTSWEIPFAVSSGLLALVLVTAPPRGGAVAKREAAEAWQARGWGAGRAMPLLVASMSLLAAYACIFTALDLSARHGGEGDVDLLRMLGLPAIAASPWLVHITRAFSTVARTRLALSGSAVAAAVVACGVDQTLILGVILALMTGGIAVAAPGVLELVQARVGLRGGGRSTAIYAAAGMAGAGLGQIVAIGLGSFDPAVSELVAAGVLVVGLALVRP